MTFSEIQNAVLANGFDESLRAECKNWINFRLAWIFDIADWSFAKGTDAVTVTSGSQVLGSMPTDFAVAYALHDSTGAPLEEVGSYDEFTARYVGTSNLTTGVPEAYTVLGTTIYVGPTPAATDTGFLLSYEKAPTLLVADADVPNIPAGYHMALVHGAKAEGFKLKLVPSLADDFDADFQAAITAMQHKYLTASRPAVRQAPAYR